jgi:hypothetical protein
MGMRSLSTTLAACFLLQHMALTGEAQAQSAALRDTTAPATQLFSMVGPCLPRCGRGCAARLEGGEGANTLYATCTFCSCKQQGAHYLSRDSITLHVRRRSSSQAASLQTCTLLAKTGSG